MCQNAKWEEVLNIDCTLLYCAPEISDRAKSSDRMLAWDYRNLDDVLLGIGQFAHQKRADNHVPTK